MHFPYNSAKLQIQMNNIFWYMINPSTINPSTNVVCTSVLFWVSLTKTSSTNNMFQLSQVSVLIRESRVAIVEVRKWNMQQ